jgi:hypothetical protein
MTRNRKVIVILMLLLPLVSVGQSHLSIDLFGTPFIQQFGNISKRSTAISHPNVQVEYYKQPTQEVGILFNQRFSNNFGWLAGLSWYNDNLQLRLSTHLDHRDSLISVLNPLTNYNKNINIQRIGFKTGCGFTLATKLQLDFIISTHFNIRTKINPESHFEAWSYYNGSPEHHTHIQVYEREGLSAIRVIPEIKLSAEIWNNFRIHLGSRLRFIGKPYLTTSVKGSFETVEYTDKTLHFSLIGGTDISYFMGITYRIGVAEN